MATASVGCARSMKWAKVGASSSSTNAIVEAIREPRKQSTAEKQLWLQAGQNPSAASMFRAIEAAIYGGGVRLDPPHQEGRKWGAKSGRSFKCDKCSESRSTQRALSYHKLLAHETAAGTGAATSGGMDSSTGSSSRHSSSINNGANSSSSSSSSSSSGGSASNINNNGASGIVEHKQFTCPQCARTYSRADSLQTHFRTVHQGRKDYPCLPCGRAFSQIGSLRRHNAAFHSEKPKQQCDLCTTFSTHVKAELERHHKRVHEKQRDHACKHAGCVFTAFSNGDVLQHVYAVHLAAGSKCPHCPTRMARQGDLNRHVREVHCKQKRQKLSSAGGGGGSSKKMSEV